MARIDPTGVTPTTLEGYVARLEEVFQNSLGTDLNLTQTCLLYTSPSPRDRTRSRMPSSA